MDPAERLERLKQLYARWLHDYAQFRSADPEYARHVAEALLDLHLFISLVERAVTRTARSEEDDDKSNDKPGHVH